MAFFGEIFPFSLKLGAKRGASVELEFGLDDFL